MGDSRELADQPDPKIPTDDEVFKQITPRPKYKKVPQSFNSCREVSQVRPEGLATWDTTFMPEPEVFKVNQGEVTGKCVFKPEKPPVIEIPKWEWNKRTVQENQSYEKMIERLTQHEKGHLIVAQRIGKTIENLPPIVIKQEPDETEAAVLTRFKEKMLERMKLGISLIEKKALVPDVAKGQPEYDVITEHGMKQSKGPTVAIFHDVPELLAINPATYPGGNDVGGITCTPPKCTNRPDCVAAWTLTATKRVKTEIQYTLDRTPPEKYTHKSNEELTASGEVTLYLVGESVDYDIHGFYDIYEGSGTLTRAYTYDSKTENTDTTWWSFTEEGRGEPETRTTTDTMSGNDMVDIRGSAKIWWSPPNMGFSFSITPETTLKATGTTTSVGQSGTTEYPIGRTVFGDIEWEFDWVSFDPETLQFSGSTSRTYGVNAETQETINWTVTPFLYKDKLNIS